MTAPDRTPEFVDLLARSSRPVYAFIMSLLRRAEDTEEVYQEVCRTLWEKFEQFQSGTNFTAWACEIAYLKVQEFRRRSRRLPALFSDVFVEAVEQEFAAEIEEVQRRYTALQDCLEKLTDRDRSLVARRYGGSISPALLAVEEARSVSAIHKALTRIHRALHDCIDRTLRREERA